MRETQAVAVSARPAAADRLRVLLLSSDTFPPTRVDITALLGAELVARGHTIDMILQSAAACRRSYVTKWSGGRVWVAATDNGPSLYQRIRKHLLAIREDLGLFRRLHSGDYDLLVIKDKFLSGALGLLAATLYKRRFIYWLSYPFPESYLERARDGTARYPLLYWIRGVTFHALLYRLLLPRADHVFVQSELMLQNIAARSIPATKMTAVPMGVLPEMFVNRTENADRAPLVRRPCIVYLGTLARFRRLDFLLRAFALVRATVPRATLALVGSGDDPSDERFLLEEADNLGLRAAILITGHLPRDRALDYVACADVCVSPVRPHPILNCGSPTKLLEYMAMGKAVVANDHPEQRSLIECSGAGRCVPYDERTFSAAILDILSDPERARDMGRAGRRYVLQHRSYTAISALVERDMLRLASATRMDGSR